MSDDEGVLDPWVEEWFDANPMYRQPFDELTPELLQLARTPMNAPVTREIARVRDDVIDGVPVRFYEHDGAPTGVVVYFHGGGFCLGSVGLMDNVARETAHATGAAVVSVEYRLAPEHPFPAGLDDCTAVTRWALAHAADLGTTPDRVVVAGESAGATSPPRSRCGCATPAPLRRSPPRCSSIPSSTPTPTPIRRAPSSTAS